MGMIQIKDIFLGGTADSKYYGIPNSQPRIVGFDLHSEVGLMKVNQKMTNDSGSTVDALCKARVSCSNGNTYWGASTSGKIWERTSAGSWSLKYTVAASAGASNILEMYEYNGYLYIATQSRLHRIPVANASGTWSSYISLNWQAFNLDQELGGTGATAYTMTTAVNEGATHKQTFTALKTPLESVAVNLAAVGTGNVTVTVHDSSNNVIGSKQILNASLAVGFTIFEFSTPLVLTTGQSYHVHVHSSVADATVVSNVATDFEGGNLKTYTTSDDTYHPMREVNLVLYIGDKNVLHQVETNVDTLIESFSQDALDIAKPNRITSLAKKGTSILIGTKIASSVNKCSVFTWNTWSDSFNNEDELEENGINAFIEADNYILASAGDKGNLYMVGDVAELYKKLKGNYGSSNTMTVFPNATGIFRGNPILGVSNVSGNPNDQGIWSIAHYGRDYPLVLTLEFPISQLDGDEYNILSNVEIGSILVSGGEIFMSWKDSTGSPAYGVDKLDTSNKIKKPFFESRVIAIDRTSLETIQRITAHYTSLPANTSIIFKLEEDHAGSFGSAESTKDDTQRKQVYAEDLGNEAKVFRLRTECISSSNNAPEIEEVQVEVGTNLAPPA